MNKYKIAEFHDGLSIIPLNWITSEEDMARWPPYKSQNKINIALINMENPTETWQHIKILRTFSSAKTWEEAKEKLRLAEKDSDLEYTENPVEYRRTRRDRAAKVDSDSSECEEQVDNEKQKAIKPILNSRINFPRLRIQDSNLSVPLYVETSKDIETEENCVSDSHDNSDKRRQNEDSNYNMMIIAFLKELTSITNKNQVILKNIEKSLQEHGTKKKSRQVSSTDWSKTVPFKNMEDLISFDKNLSENPVLAEEMMEMLKGIGGRDDRAKINNIMEKILSDDLGLQFSWKGQKGKSSLEKLELGKILLYTMIECKTSFSEMEIKGQMGSWLAGRKAKFRRMTNKEIITQSDQTYTPDSEPMD